jgi:peptidoglycan/LPS O-acetylase OafA/YrhL
LGLLAAASYHVILHSPGKTRLRPPPPLVGSTFVAVFLCFIFPPPHFATLIAAPLMAAFTVNHANDLPELFKKVLSFRLLRWFGIASFSIYLWQQPFYLLFVHFDAPRALCLPFAIALGFASFHFIENPVRIYLNGRYASTKIQTLPADRHAHEIAP